MNSNNSLIQSLTTCIVGGGSSAHVLVPFLAEAGHRVNLLTRRPEEWHEVIYCEITDSKTGTITRTHAGSITSKSSNPADVIPDADIIILCMPVHQYRPALDRIAPFLNKEKEIFVGTIYGQGGFNWMVHSIERKYELTQLVTFAIGQIPWICRQLVYGQSCANFGGKQVNTVAVSPADKFHQLESILLNDLSFRPMNVGKFEQACSFLSITLSVDNQIIHPGRCYGLYSVSGGEWASDDKVPMFYRDFDGESAENIRRIDEEYTLIKTAIRKKFPNLSFKYMLSYMDLEKLNHRSNHDGILSTFVDSSQLAAITTPTVVGPGGKRLLNKNCRFFTDDIPYGLLIAKWMAVKLNVETPFIDGVIMWAQTMRGESFLSPGGVINMDYCLSSEYKSGIPESYGYSNLEELLN